MNKNRHPVISEFLDYIRNIRRYSLNTIRSYSYDLEEYYMFCKDFDPQQDFIKLDHVAIQSYMQYLSRKGLNAKTLARRLASIKSFYKYMLINKIIKINSAKLIRTPKINRELPHYLSLKEAQDILQLPIGNDEKALRERLILELFYATGIRISELINITIEDIRIEEGIIHILGKGSKERIVMLGQEATHSLHNYFLL
jgi:site-specific recombinase XerD